MNQKNSDLNKTLQRVAAFCGLRLSYFITAILLAASFLFFILIQYKTATPLYILLCLALLPTVLQTIFFPAQNQKKRETKLPFPLFCQKYHYTASRYFAMNLAYLLIFLLFAAWAYSYRTTEHIPTQISWIPAGIVCCSLFSRLCGTVGYRLYFYLFPLKAMR